MQEFIKRVGISDCPRKEQRIETAYWQNYTDQNKTEQEESEKLRIHYWRLPESTEIMVLSDSIH